MHFSHHHTNTDITVYIYLSDLATDTDPSLSPSDLHPQLFRLITPNVILIKNSGVKGFSLPEKRVQIVAQWQSSSLAWEEMHSDISQVVPTRPEPHQGKHTKGYLNTSF